MAPKLERVLWLLRLFGVLCTLSIVVGCTQITQKNDEPTAAEIVTPAQLDVVSHDQDVAPDVAKDNSAFRPIRRAQTHGSRLTLGNVLVDALRNDPDVGVATAQLDDAKAAVKVAFADKFPVIDLTGTAGLENTYTETTTDVGVEATELNLSLEQKIYDFGATDEAIERRLALVRSAELRRRDTEEEVALAIVAAYLDYLRSDAIVRASGANERNHRRITELVILNEQGGNATQADVSRASTRFEAARTDTLNARTARQDAISVFERLTGVHPKNVIVPKRLAPRVSGSRSLSLDAMIRSNPELKSLEEDRAALERQIGNQQAAIKPEVFFRAEAGIRNDVGGNTGLAGDLRGTVGFRTRLYSGGARRAAIEQTEARIREIDETYRGVYRDLEQQVDTLDQRISTGSEKSRLVSERFRTAREGRELFQTQFEGGERSAFELLDSQRDLFQAEREVINNRFDQAEVVYQKLRLRGDLVSSLVAGN